MYIASVYSKGSLRALYKSKAHPTREEAAREAFQARPKAKEVSTCRAHKVGKKWEPNHMDIRWFRRDQIENA